MDGAEFDEIDSDGPVDDAGLDDVIAIEDDLVDHNVETCINENEGDGNDL